MAANLWFAAGDFGGRTPCERGDSPLSQAGNGPSRRLAPMPRRAGAERRRILPGTQAFSIRRPFRASRSGADRGRRKPSPRFNAVGDTRSRCGRHRENWPDRRSKPSPRFNAMGYFRARKKQMAANLWFAAGDFGGKCERGDSPLSQDGNDQSELAAARRRRAREFRLPARSAGRTPDGAPNPSRTTTESYSGSWPRPGSAPRLPVGTGAPRPGFALTRDAGRDRRSMGRRWWGGFRAHARCRSETGGFRAPRRVCRVGDRRSMGRRRLGRVSRSRAMPVGDRRSWGGVGGAGFALTRDAGRRPALHGAALVVRVSRSRAMPVGDGGAGFALTRDAGRRPALGRRWWGGFRASRAMPVGDRRSWRPCDSTRWGTSERAKNKWQRTSGSLPAISGECVKGGILPFHN